MSADESAAEWERKFRAAPWNRLEHKLIPALESRERQLAAAQARVGMLEAALREVRAELQDIHATGEDYDWLSELCAVIDETLMFDHNIDTALAALRWREGAGK